MNATGFDYYRDAPEPTIGLSRTATLIRQARAEAERQGALVLLFDNGDSLQGTPIGEWAARRSGTQHPLMQAFDALRYDAIGLGNHDFGFGLEVLDRVISQSSCPVICSNADRLDRKSSWGKHTILTRTVRLNGRDIPIKVGVLSVLPPQTAQWEAHHIGGLVQIDDILISARNTARALKSAGCDIVIALAHTGLGEVEADTNLENAIIPLAAIEAIDAIIAGHTHLTLPGSAHDGLAFVDNIQGRVHGKPVVMAGSAGSHLGVIDLTLRHEANDRWTVIDHSSCLREVNPATSQEPITEDPEIVKIFSEGHARTREHANETVGHTTTHLHSYFSFCAQDRGLALVAAAQVAALRAHLGGTEFAMLPVLSAVSPSKFGGRAGPRCFTDIAAGKLCLRHVADLNVFPNQMQATVVTGLQIRDWLEMSAGVLNQMLPGHQTELVNSLRAGYNFDVLHGLTYEIDLSKPARFDARGRLMTSDANRIKDLRFNGRPVEDKERFVVALNNYRANGGGHFPFVGRATHVPLPVLPIQHIVRDYLSGVLPPDPLEKTPPAFRLHPVPGAYAVLKTGLQAQQHFDELSVYEPVILDHDSEGFLIVRLTL